MTKFFGSKTRFEATIIKLVSAIQEQPNNIKFNVAFFDEGIHWTDGTFKLRPANQLKKQNLVTQVAKLNNSSGTDYTAAVSLPPMLNPLPDQGILLSDGEPRDNRFLNQLKTLFLLGIQVDTIGPNAPGNGKVVLPFFADETGGNLHQVD